MKIYRRILLFLVLICLAAAVTACMKPSIEEVRAKMKEYLQQKYGKEFVVSRIGTRQDEGRREYVARVYPKEIVGTKKMHDDYYYGRATVDQLSFGKLGNAGDSYSYVQLNLGAEKYLMPKLKEIFGQRILMKVDTKLKIWGREEIIIEAYREKYGENNGSDAFIGYKESNFKKARGRVVNDPENNRLFLELYVYVFDRIEDKAEKEKRREDIFEFVQYLKGEGLFKYLELGVIFMDERVLADSYDSYKWEVEDAPKVEKEIQGETVYLPPMELRKEMSEELQKEVDQMSEGELLNNMKEIRKDELNYQEMREYNGQYQSWVSSVGMLKNDPRILFEKYKKNNDLKKHQYNETMDITVVKDRQYIYINVGYKNN